MALYCNQLELAHGIGLEWMEMEGDHERVEPCGLLRGRECWDVGTKRGCDLRWQGDRVTDLAGASPRWHLDVLLKGERYGKK